MTEPAAQPDGVGARCPRCGAELAPEQEWCLSCGTAARTVLAPPPRWQAPIALIAIVVVLFGAAAAWALVELTSNDAEVQASTVEPVTTTIEAPSAATATAPTATVPPGSGDPSPETTATAPADATDAPPPDAAPAP